MKHYFLFRFLQLNCLIKLHCKPHLGFDTPSHQSKTRPLHLAAHSGSVLCLKWLLQCGAGMNKQDFMGETALHKAAKVGNSDSVAMLVSHGASLNSRNHRGLTPEELADESGYTQVVTYLKQAAELSDYGGTTRTNTNNCQTSINTDLNTPNIAGQVPTISEQNRQIDTGVTHPFIFMNGEGIHNSVSGTEPAICDDEAMDECADSEMADSENMSAEGCMCFPPGPEPKGRSVFTSFGNENAVKKKRGIDSDDEEEMWPSQSHKRVCFVPMSQKTQEERYGTPQNNNIISSYNSILAVKTEPMSTPDTPFRPSSSPNQAVSSVLEHNASIVAQQGYDSTFIQTLTNAFH